MSYYNLFDVIYNANNLFGHSNEYMSNRRLLVYQRRRGLPPRNQTNNRKCVYLLPLSFPFHFDFSQFHLRADRNRMISFVQCESKKKKKKECECNARRRPKRRATILQIILIYSNVLKERMFIHIM